MNQLFKGATIFNGDISSWDTSQVTDMEKMFNGNTGFTGDLSSWDISKVTVPGSLTSPLTKAQID